MKDFVFRYSAIDTSYRCLRRFDLQYVRGIKADEQSPDLDFGTSMHAALRAVLEHDEDLGKVDPEQLFEKTWGVAKAKTHNYTRGNWDEYRDYGLSFISKFLRLHAKKYQPLHLEKELQFNVGPHKFSGTVDFIGHLDGTLSVVDFKTSTYPYHKDKIEVAPQLWLYTHAAKQQLGLDIQQIAYTVFVKNADRRIQTIKFSLTQAKLDDMIESVIRQCDMIVATKDLPKNLNSCIMGERKCPYYLTCHPKKENTNG